MPDVLFTQAYGDSQEEHDLLAQSAGRSSEAASSRLVRLQDEKYQRALRL